MDTTRGKLVAERVAIESYGEVILAQEGEHADDTADLLVTFDPEQQIR
jgi:hypothetical protein